MRSTNHRSATLAARAHSMRCAQTETEEILWRELRSSRLGVPFRRQVVLLGRFIVDFLAPSARLIIEVDGGYHVQCRSADESRERKLRRAGYRVVRVSAEDVRGELPVVVARIRAGLGP
jgi:very-short-patch-repair endonuclease